MKTKNERRKTILRLLLTALLLTMMYEAKAGTATSSETDSNAVIAKPATLHNHSKREACTDMQSINHSEWIPSGKDWMFVENKGQLVTDDAKYYIHNSGINVYCKAGMISFVFTKKENETGNISEATGKTEREREEKKEGKITATHTDLVFIGANANAKILASDQQSYYENYYTTGDANGGIANVHTFKKLTYKNIYPHIDMLLKVAHGHGMEYSFLVHPGGNVADIKMQWNGAAQESMNEWRLPDGKHCSFRYSNALGNIEESASQSFVGGKQVPCHFIKTGDYRGFKVEYYNKNMDLLIDPGLWATYYGGSSDDEGYAVNNDGTDVYITGRTSSTGLATSGVYQTSNGGSADVFLAKFNTTGGEDWTTYYGGSADDYGYGVSSDGAGNIYVTGITESLSGIATSGAYETAPALNGNGFLAQFSSSGSLNWATFYGGGGADQGQGVSTDGAGGNVYITGITSSTSGIATSGTYQTTYGGSTDGFLAKFSSAGVQAWATYYGGSGQDQGWGVSTDASGNVYITGNTASSSGISTLTGFQSVYGGSTDAFLAKFDGATGNLTWGTYYGGSNFDQARGVGTDGSGNIYITGYASSNGLASIGAYQTIQAGGDAFLAKFNSSGGEAWATYYGGSSEDDGWAVTADGSGNVYITGYTTSSNGIATAGAYQTVYGGGGGYDAFLAKFSSAGGKDWGTYYGGSANDFGQGVSTDGSGNVYLTGYTGSSGLSSSGAFQTAYGGSVDAFLAKFNSAGALPVTLLTFNAQYQENHVNLNWATASEQNNAYFEMERSTDASTWTDIGQVQGHGTSNDLNNYEAIDNLEGVVQSGTFYYRLKQVDFNGKYTYSEIRAVNLTDAVISIQTYPVPVTSTLNIDFANEVPRSSLEIANTCGTILYTEYFVNKGIIHKQVEMGNYPLGIYFLRIRSGNSVITRKVVRN